MRNKNGPVPPPWGEDMEEAWRAQYKALQEGRVTASPRRKPSAVGRLITIGVVGALLLAYFCSTLDGFQKG